MARSAGHDTKSLPSRDSSIRRGGDFAATKRRSPALTASAARCRRKFLNFFPGGFRDSTYLEWERDYKWETHQRWHARLDRDEMRSLLLAGEFSEIAARAVRVEQQARHSMIFSFEKMALRDAVRAESGARAFARGLYEFLYGRGSDQRRFEAWSQVVADLPRRQTRVLTWPLVTVFGFIAQPERHVFLKPLVTRAAARAYRRGCWFGRGFFRLRRRFSRLLAHGLFLQRSDGSSADGRLLDRLGRAGQSRLEHAGRGRQAATRPCGTSRWQSQQRRSPVLVADRDTSVDTCPWQRRQLASTTGTAPSREPDHLRLPAHGEHRGVPQTVFGLEARSATATLSCGTWQSLHVATSGMAAVLPGDVLRGHHVAVHARLRGVAQVRGGPRNVEHEQPRPGQHAEHEETRQPPGAGARGTGGRGASDRAVFPDGRAHSFPIVPEDCGRVKSPPDPNSAVPTDPSAEEIHVVAQPLDFHLFQSQRAADMASTPSPRRWGLARRCPRRARAR